MILEGILSVYPYFIFSLILFNQFLKHFFIIILLNKTVVTRNKDIKHHWVHGPCYKIKFFNLYLSLDFTSVVFNYCK